MSDTTFCLNCIVLGDKPSGIFSVEIASSETVYDLKERVKNAKEYVCPAADLDLFLPSEKVACWTDEDEDGVLMQAWKEGGHRCLFPRHVLSAIFKPPFCPDALHILVSPPSTREFFVLLLLLY
ncbi:hypothetical protein EDC04DRAFT_2651127 [Pisolithus marmoratus]|nr:hypothetical protein EDC04DRAFT_2651127 [Pisolithus marmoratus]